MNKILLSLFLLFAIAANGQKSNKRELRGAWITTYASLDWPVRTQTPTQQRTALLSILDHHRQTGINTVYFQVRSQCDAMYPSPIEPWSYDLTGNQNVAPNPLWDPLQFSIDESRKRGFEFHAWLNPFRAVASTGNAGNTAMFSPAHISKTHPEWLLTIGTVQILNPGLPQVRAYITSVVADIINRYDVDGIHFDDYFYPNTTSTINDDAAYLADPRGFPNTSAGRADWRRDNVNLFIAGVYQLITTTKPWIKFGVSPTGIYRSSTNPAIGSATSSGALQHYSNLYADSKKWLQQGWVDYIAPQLYWFIGQSGSDYAVLVPWWNNNAFGRHIYIGMAAYKVNDPAQGTAWANRSQIPNQVRMNRNEAYPNVVGSIYFRTLHLRNNPLNMRDSLRLHFYNKPALQPAMAWRDNTPPQPATGLTATKYGSNYVQLNWTAPPAVTNELDRARQFVIYRSAEPVIDLEDQENILAITTSDATDFKDLTAGSGTYFYAVTALDRFHNESTASNVANNLPPEVSCPPEQELVVNNSCNITVPDYRPLALVTSSSAGITVTQTPAPGTVINGTGMLAVTIRATDMAGNWGQCSFNVNRKDETPPVVSNASVTPGVLLVPNHKMRTVSVGYLAMDNCGPVTVHLTVSSNETANGNGSGNTATDWEIVNNTTVKLRAERSGTGNGRIYTITIHATDASGNVTTQEVYVTVPHNHSSVTMSRVGVEARSPFSLVVTPNPSASVFQLRFDGGGTEDITLIVRNSLGQVVERKSSIAAGSVVSIGSGYKAGVYLVEAVQGDQVKQLKIIKSE